MYTQFAIFLGVPLLVLNGEFDASHSLLNVCLYKVIIIIIEYSNV